MQWSGCLQEQEQKDFQSSIAVSLWCGNKHSKTILYFANHSFLQKV